jgi:hypothetical protein
MSYFGARLQGARKPRMVLALLLGMLVMTALLPAAAFAVVPFDDSNWPIYWTLDVVPGGVWSRQAVSDHMYIFDDRGFNQNFAWYSNDTVLQSGSWDGRVWASRGIDNGSTWGPSGGYYWTPLGSVFYRPPATLHVWEYGGSFIAKACGNMSWSAVNPAPPSISGRKWQDSNGNGAWDGGESGVAGWRVRLYRDGVEWASATTDGNGYYRFTLDANAGYRPGWWEVREDVQNGWVATYGGSRWVYVAEGSGSAGREFGGNDFGNFRLGKISGSKWIDMNGDGVRDGVVDPTRQGWPIQLIRNGSMYATTYTDQAGNYEFTGLPVGTYQVREVVLPGWKQTHPHEPQYTLPITSGSEYVGIDFGNTAYASVTPLKIEDADRDGQQDDGENYLSGWTMWLQGSGFGPASVTTGGQPDRWASLLPGSYTVWEEMQDGWVPTGEATLTVQLFSGQNVFVNFYNARAFGAIEGVKYHDFNGNGTREDWEPGIEGWKITLTDAEGNETSASTDANGRFAFDKLEKGHYTVAEEQCDHWLQTTATSGDVDLDWAQTFDISFGNRLTGDIVGVKYEDKTGNGVLDDEDVAVPGVEMSLVASDGSIVGTPVKTDEHGRYAFKMIPPDVYTVVESLSDGWKASAGDKREVRILGNDVVTPDPFLNVKLASISGAKFDDSDNDAARDADERLLPGWGVALEQLKDGSWSEVATTTTGEDGTYRFTGLWPGTYRAVEEERTDWLQKAAPAEVTVQSSSEVRDFDFGNIQYGDVTALKWDDSNGNGVMESSETPIANWEFSLSRSGSNDGGMMLAADDDAEKLLTDANGTAKFGKLLPSHYSLAESSVDLQIASDGKVIEPGWQPTTESVQATDLAEGTHPILRFGNIHMGWVWGRVTHEVWGTPEPGIKVVLEETGQQTTTDANGYYYFYTVMPNETTAAPTPDYLVGMDLDGTTWKTHDAVDKSVVVREGLDGRADFTVYGENEALGNIPRTIGYWKNWNNHFTAAQMTALVAKVRAGSTLFSDLQVADVYTILQLDKKTDMQSKAKAQFLAVWLNMAADYLGFDTSVNVSKISGWRAVVTSADSTGHVTVLTLVNEVESYFVSGQWSRDVWEVIKNVLDALNNKLIS